MAHPTDDDIKARIGVLVREVDLNQCQVKDLIAMLSKDFQVEMKPQKAFIKAAISEAISAMNDNNEEEEEEEEESEEEAEEEESESEEEEEVATPAPRKKKGGGGGGGLNAKKEISAELAAFLKQGGEMSRPMIVKGLWEYIREHDLQNPDDRREIVLDGPMRQVFGCSTFTMFSMNKYIGAHVHPFKPVDLTTNSTTPKKRKKPSSGKKGKDSSGKKRKPMNQPLYRLSEELAAVVGVSVLSRPQVVSKLWEHIKANELQNPSDKREILCDDMLRAVMKKKKVTMFNMNTFISPHFLERVEKTDDGSE